ncbi:NTP transferase domain-containing protein [Agromyces sp. SYSU T0242]|uniref:NTP transferase domain-containing protein n=1 Tax=Agromyces litoreus TaxID=3158561 RepID=UPI0033935197
MSTGMRAAAWTVVIPVKSLTGAKTRLAPELSPAERASLARAFALDTVDAARAAQAVARVVVVSDEPAIAAALGGVPGVDVVPESAPRGLTAAIAQGIAVARADAASDASAAAGPGGSAGPSRPARTVERERRPPAATVRGTAVLLGDLPALRPEHLDAALEGAARHPRAFVPDAEGTGTTLATASPGVAFVPHFGRDSAARHRAAGYADLTVRAAAGPGSVAAALRRDVDTAAELAEAVALGVGARTAEVVGALDGPHPVRSGRAPWHPLDPSTAPAGAATAPHGADRKAVS